MSRSTANIIADIRKFRPVDDNWLPLDELLSELWESKEPSKYVLDVLAVFERFPEEDGAGVLWSIVHGLESLGGYEQELVRSIQRQPSELGLTMAGRLLKDGTTEVNGISLLSLLQSVAKNRHLSARLREVAKGFADQY